MMNNHHGSMLQEGFIYPMSILDPMSLDDIVGERAEISHLVGGRQQLAGGGRQHSEELLEGEDGLPMLKHHLEV